MTFCRFIRLHIKWSFPLKIFSVNMTKFAVSCQFGHIYWRNLWWKTPAQCLFFRILFDFFKCNIQKCVSWNSYWELFFNQTSVLQPANVIKKWSFLQIVIKTYACFLGRGNLRNNSILPRGHDGQFQVRYSLFPI